MLLAWFPHPPCALALIFALGATTFACACRSGENLDSQGTVPSDTATDTSPGKTEQDELGGACDSAERVGGFALSLAAYETTVNGSVSVGVVPSAVLHELAVESPCRLLQRRNPHCDPPCLAGETCHPDLECIPYPETKSVGAVTVDGLAVSVNMLPVQPSNVYFNTMLPHPAFAAGDEIELRAAGDQLAGFTLRGVGIVAIDDLKDEIWPVRRGRPLAASWTPGPGGPARLHLALNIDQHGNSPANIECDVRDTGSFDIPATLIDQLFDLGISGFPSLVLTRRTADSVTLDVGCVDFNVRSWTTVTVEVADHIPCMSDADCPEDMTCNLATETCE
ncbi:MAG: hypothetical protein V3V08_20335 [Nannocystaceae bacterium]